MTKRKFAFFGHSHLAALQRGHKTLTRAGRSDCEDAEFFQLRADTFQPNFEQVLTAEILASDQAQSDFLRRWHGRPPPDLSSSWDWRFLDSNLEKQLDRTLSESAPDCVVMVCMGNEYNFLAMVQHETPFDFYHPDDNTALNSDATIISHGEVAAQMQLLAEANVLLFWRFMSTVFDGPLLLVPPPPPIESAEHITQFGGAFAARVNEFGVSPAPIRRKMYLTYCDVLRQTATETGGRYFELPEAVFDRGYLHPDFWQSDPTHANADYGALVYQAVVDSQDTDG